MGDLMMAGLAEGAARALTLEAMLYCTLGVTLGMFVGVLPGIGILATIALLMPLTYHLDPMIGITMLAGIYYGSAYGGSTASILLNLPGTANTAVTCLDGYPMAKQGRAGVALFMTTFASFIGSIIGILMLALFAFPIAKVAIAFGSQEYFALAVLGLVAGSMMSDSTPFKALAMVAAGVGLGLVGIDVSTGLARFTFGVVKFSEGIALVSIALGLFGLAEMLRNVAQDGTAQAKAHRVTLRSMWPNREDWRRSTPAIGRGTAIGSFFGILPGTGSMIASFVSYAVERRFSRHPQEFGHGAIEGVAGPEAANNAAVQTAFIPTLTLGIPGDAVMALMLGVLMIHGITPGPQVLTDEPGLFWGLIISFLFGNLVLLILNIPLIGLWVRVLSIPFHYLFPAIMGFLCIGVYSLSYAVLDLWVMAVFGVLGYGMYRFCFPIAPMLLGLILGPMLEENFRRAMQLQKGDPLGFFEKPLSAAFMILAALMLIQMIWSEVKRRRAK